MNKHADTHKLPNEQNTGITPKQMHLITFIAGLSFLVFSVVTAIVFRYAHFYTSFALGSWLVLDFIDYKLTNRSILGFFYNNRHRRLFFVFFILSTIFCILVDYVLGVKVSGMWEWVEYEAIHFIRMYIFMNISYVLGMYELYRVIKYLLKPYILENHIFKVRIQENVKVFASKVAIILGIVFMLSPFYVFLLSANAYIEYVMVLPFISMLMISDSITYLTGGNPISRNIFRGNILMVFSLLATVLVASLVTEILNLFGGEWNYLKMPFQHIQLWGIPVAVFIGWVPLVVSAISIVNLVTHLPYAKSFKEIRSS